ICMAVSIFVSWLIFHSNDRIGEFSAAFSNAGFIGIPLVQATFGSHAVFYISMMVVLVNFLQWTYGVFTITDDKSYIDLRKVIRNPIVIAVFIGLVIYFSGIRMPALVDNVFDIISAINTPLAMMASGVYLAQSELLDMLKKKDVYLVCFVRLIIIPMVIMAVFTFLPLGSEQIKLAILLAASCPVGSNVAIFAQQYNKDYRKAIEYVCVSTILSILTLPLIMYLAASFL
ncbi:MAG: AEC family transporter, partial [Erysipelotrichaceae bacterium]|nr:AEC family transporter [Erysipelotrichaceae bacterium]